MSLIGLGRVHSHDPRSASFPLEAPATTRTSRFWSTRGQLDQGDTSECVAYSGVRYLTTGPVVNKPVVPHDLYKECQTVDEWPGEDYDGTSVLALFKVLKSRGYVTEYRWASDLETVVSYLLEKGPVVMGTDWYEEMFVTDRWGYIQAKGAPAGGHAWVLIGANRKKKNPDGTVGAVRMINSWGKGWGQNGRAWLTFKDLEKLMLQPGEEPSEACVATEVVKR